MNNRFPPEQATTILKFIPNLRIAVAFKGIESHWEAARNLLSDEALYSLEVLEHHLEGEPEIPQNDLDKIANQIDELFAQLQTSSINTRLRKWIMSWLAVLKQGIDRFKIHGPKGLQDALIRIQGEADVFGSALERVKEEDPSLFDKFEEFWNWACEATKMLDRCQKLYESGKQIARFGIRLLPAIGLVTANHQPTGTVDTLPNGEISKPVKDSPNVSSREQ